MLTEKGNKIGRMLVDRHKILEDFLRIIGVKDEERIYIEVEGIEHHLSPSTILAIGTLVKFFEDNPLIIENLMKYLNT